MNDHETNNHFNVLDEIGRGALYRGGESMENYLRGYYCGVFIIGGIIAAKILPVILANMFAGRGITG